MATCGWEGEDSTCPEFDPDTSLECTCVATKKAVVEMSGPFGTEVQEVYSCDAHATPIDEGFGINVLDTWEDIK